VLSPQVIAEVGVNHNGDLALAHQLLRAAKQAGADWVKFQLFEPERLVLNDAPLATYQQRSAGAPAHQHALLSPLALGHQAMAQLAEAAQAEGLRFLCTPFDTPNARFLIETLGLPALKVSSGDLTALPLLAEWAALGRPLWLSTGMATLAEVEQAVAWVTQHSPLPAHEAVVLFHCVSAYPTPPDQANLRAITTLNQAFPQLAVGWSDHTLGPEAAVVATALGATHIEKHLTLSTHLPGPDHAASATPDAFAAMVQQVRQAALLVQASGHKVPQPAEANVAQVARRCLVATRALPQGHRLTPGDVTCLRPATAGANPLLWPHWLGQPLAHPVAAGQPLAHTALMPAVVEGLSAL
jgi:N,N'-diacetyllegionaminate synthase